MKQFLFLALAFLLSCALFAPNQKQQPPYPWDKDNNVSLTPPASKEGARQLKDIRKLSRGVDLRIEGQEIVVPLN